MCVIKNISNTFFISLFLHNSQDVGIYEKGENIEGYKQGLGRGFFGTFEEIPKIPWIIKK